ncbi:putative membrane protein [Gottschalkia acidurici 9a]|uniref:Membrane protein n=1 Tax=Gottschalkia acidurici (strain ATCC 7906 / DSM 604 / BCRC 14475 / CIP 104303 / KCTC 5404 / NCIMB 10678 / 9a) TaxID=1128398 RepID=K0AZZ2_GOTA9|nr:DUF445 family protein [Gottschalkia acidurici]AFS77921.1 putative membrane protein [Gottschalkia acidurici 9a]
MDNVIKILILASIGALIGWITNVLAIKLIFRPLKPVSFLGIKIQGLIPKRRDEIAKSIGEVVENELISITDIMNTIVTDENIDSVKEVLKVKIKDVIIQKVPSFILGPFKDKVDSYVDNMIDNEGDDIIEELIDRVSDKALKNISLSKIVEEKINSFELEKIEKIIISIAKRELKHIEILGGVLGFLIGVVQGLIVTLI